jgi:hypothetical protein
VLIAATGANAFHKCVRYRIINRVASMRGKVSARPGVISHSPFLHFPPTARTYSCVKELDGLKRRVVARPCIYPFPCARQVLNHFARELHAASFHLRSLSHKLESLQASYPQMLVRR